MIHITCNMWTCNFPDMYALSPWASARKDHAICVSLVTEITTPPVSAVTAVALEDVTLTCSASVDDVAYSWHRVDGSVPSRSQGQNSKRFTIPQVTPPDEGMYYCIAVKDGVRVESKRTILNVDGKSLCSKMVATPMYVCSII